jgi:hypothetical protein
MENHAPLVVGEDAFQFSASLGIEGYAHSIICDIFQATGAGRLMPVRNKTDQKTGRDYLYRLNTTSSGVRDISFEGKAELFPWNHFYELILFYVGRHGVGGYEYGNAQKTTAHLMLYVNYAAGYVIVAQRVTWMHIAQELVLDAVSGPNAKPLFAALNGKTHLELAAVGRQFPHATVAAKILKLVRERRWPHVPFAVFDLRELFAKGWLSKEAGQAKCEYAQELMLRKYPSYGKTGNEPKLEQAVENFLGLMKYGERDFAQMNRLLRDNGGIRPAEELAGWVEALPPFAPHHAQPIQRFGKEFLEIARNSTIVTNQAQPLADEFNRLSFVPHTDASADYFQRSRELPALKFRMRRK